MNYSIQKIEFLNDRNINLSFSKENICMFKGILLLLVLFMVSWQAKEMEIRRNTMNPKLLLVYQKVPDGLFVASRKGQSYGTLCYISITNTLLNCCTSNSDSAFKSWVSCFLQLCKIPQLESICQNLHVQMAIKTYGLTSDLPQRCIQYPFMQE